MGELSMDNTTLREWIDKVGLRTIHAIECNRTRTGATIYYRFGIQEGSDGKTWLTDITGEIALALRCLKTKNGHLALSKKVTNADITQAIYSKYKRVCIVQIMKH